MHVCVFHVKKKGLMMYIKSESVFLCKIYRQIQRKLKSLSDFSVSVLHLHFPDESDVFLLFFLGGGRTPHHTPRIHGRTHKHWWNTENEKRLFTGNIWRFHQEKYHIHYSSDSYIEFYYLNKYEFETDFLNKDLIFV